MGGARGAGAVLLLAGLLGACAGAGPGPGTPPAAVAPAPEPDEAAGIQVTALRISAAGRVVDLRYRVIDAGKAKVLLGKQAEVYAVDQASGIRLPVPRAAKVGSLRQTAAAAVEGKIYFILFGNTNRVVKPGSRLTVVIGDLKLTDLVVE